MMTEQEMISTAKAMVAPGKGILAADESYGTANKRFEKLGIPTTEEIRRAYREIVRAKRSTHLLTVLTLQNEWHVSATGSTALWQWNASQ
jgi:fructose-bisphosphate aldolase class 1